MAVGVGTLEGIAIKREQFAPLELVEEVEVTIEQGLAGDCKGNRLKPSGEPTKRQVTALSKQSWAAACALVGKEIPWEMRRAGLLITGIMFDASDVGKLLYIGATVILVITRETDPCKRMNAVCPGLMEALTPEWRGGVCCRVLHGGKIRKNDVVRLGA